MESLKFSTSGTLGDTYITVLKLMMYDNSIPIEIFHHTKCDFWYNEIKEIYSLLPNVKVTFVKKKIEDLDIIESTDKNSKQLFFPKFKLDNKYTADINDYIVLQPHSGKPNGNNTKKLRLEYIEKLICGFSKNIKVVLIGNNIRYSYIEGCINLVNKTNVIDLIPVISKSRTFIGPEGIMSFIALSQKIKSTIFYSDRTAVKNRILDTPWERYLLKMEKMI